MPTRKKPTAKLGKAKWRCFPQNSCKFPFLLLLQTTNFFVLVAVIVVADFAEVVHARQQQMGRPMNGRLYANMEPCQRPTVRVLFPPSPLPSTMNANGGNGDNNNDNDGLSNISTMSTIPITHQTLATGALSTSTTQQQSLASSAKTMTTATESIRTATTNSSNSMNSTSSSTNSTSSSTSSSTSTTQMPAVGHFQIEIPLQQQGAAGNVTIEAECAAQGPEKPGGRSVYTLDTAKIDWTGASELLLFNDVHILAFGYPPVQPIGIA